MSEVEKQRQEIKLVAEQLEGAGASCRNYLYFKCLFSVFVQQYPPEFRFDLQFRFCWGYTYIFGIYFIQYQHKMIYFRTSEE
jgi:hypothetical protein